MTISFRPAVRENVPLLLGVAGGTGSGKTYSALRLATGIADGGPILFVDTENGRAKMYAGDFPFQHGEIHAPFRPSKYADAVDAAEKAGATVIVVDSASHEWYGDGGCLDWHDDLMGGDQKKNLSAWIEPKRDHKKMVTRLLQVKAHVILCFRAEPKVEAAKVNGRIEIVAKKSLTGLDGWIPIAEKNLPYELTASFLLMADQPGVPKPIKLPKDLAPLVPLEEPLSEQVGRALAAWAAGTTGSGSDIGAATAAAAPAEAHGDDGQPSDPETPTVPTADMKDELLRLADELGNRAAVEAAIAKDAEANSLSPFAHADWLRRQLERARKAAEKKAVAS